jgi:hypothetical protein
MRTIRSLVLGGILVLAFASVSGFADDNLGWSCSTSCIATNSAGSTRHMCAETGTTAADALQKIFADCNTWCSTVNNADACGTDSNANVLNSCVKN